MLKALQIPHDSEPIFDHITQNEWYLDFASKHNLKIKTHDFYNPDFILADGTWLEITLSENTAYKKLFRYGHQAPLLKVLWLDEDSGLHKKVGEGFEFFNAEVISVQKYFSEFEKASGGKDLINKVLFHTDEAMSWEVVRNLKLIPPLILIIRNLCNQGNTPEEILQHLNMITQSPWAGAERVLRPKQNPRPDVQRYRSYRGHP